MSEFFGKVHNVDTKSTIQSLYLSKKLNSPLQRWLNSTHRLEDCQDRSKANLLNVIQARFSAGMPYTFVGPILLSFRTDTPGLYFSRSIKQAFASGQSLPPHIYATAANAYFSMKQTASSQVINVLGTQGSGKTFNAVHLLDQICSMASFDNTQALHDAFQALHIMGSTSAQGNLESSLCGISANLKFNPDFLMVGAEIQASLFHSLDKGRTFQILHSLLYASRDILQRLGLSLSTSYTLFGGPVQEINVNDWQVWNRFNECLRNLRFSQDEINLLTEVLACVIHLYELSERNRYSLQFVYKLIGISEEHISGLSSNDFKLLANECYNAAFTWVNKKINEKIDSKDFLYCISIVDFPGFSSKNSFGGLITNLSIESFHYFCYSEYMHLLAEMEKEHLRLLEVPLCKRIIDFFLSKDSGLINHIGVLNAEQLSEYISERNMGNIIKVDRDSILINFSFGSVKYNLEDLCYPQTNFSQLFKATSNPITKKAISINKITNKLSYSITKLLSSASSYLPHTVYCLTSDKASQIFDSLIEDTLNWKWTGYAHWLAPAEEHKLKIKPDNSIKTPNYIFITSELAQSLPLLPTLPENRTNFLFYIHKNEQKSSKPLLPPQPIEKMNENKVYNLQTNIIKIQSKKSFKTIKKLLENFEHLDYSNLNYYIIKIQSLYRGHRVRKYYRGLKRLNKSAVNIQRTWRGHITRVRLEPLFKFHNTTKKIQKLCRKMRSRKIQAVNLIQRWLRATFAYRVAVKSVQKRSVSSLHKSITQRPFSPSLSPNSIKMMNKSETGSMPFLLRNEIWNSKRKHKIEQKRQDFVDKELKEATYSPKTNDNISVPGNFSLRQSLFKRTLKAKQSSNVLSKGQMSCSMKSPAKSRKEIQDIVSGLHNWGKIRDRRIKEQQDIKESEDLNVEKFKVSEKTKKYALKRRAREQKMSVKGPSPSLWPKF